jgi:hypothetical protein
LRALCRANRGAIAAQLAIMLVALIAFVALGTEIVIMFFITRQMQSAADAAVLGAMTAKTTGYPADYSQEAQSIAASAGFANGRDATVVTVNTPPTLGSYAGQIGAVEVVITQPQTLMLVGLLRGNPFNLRVHATALGGGYGVCALALSASGDGTFTQTGGTTVTFDTCDLAVNSSSSRSLTMGGSATLNVRNVINAGDEMLSGGAVINANGTVTSHASITANPYAEVTVPSFSGCTRTNYSIGNGNTATLSPGVYCNGMSFSGAAVVTLSPGVYFVDRGTFGVSNGAKVTGIDVTIVLASSTGSNYATASFGGGAITNFTAPTTGPTAGLAFFQDPRAPVGQISDLSNGASTTVTGALYFPTQTLKFSGGTSTGSACMQLVAYKITVTNGATLRAGCSGTGVLPIGGGGTAGLVE